MAVQNITITSLLLLLLFIIIIIIFYTLECKVLLLHRQRWRSNRSFYHWFRLWAANSRTTKHGSDGQGV